jgi:hypothetical protein
MAKDIQHYSEPDTNQIQFHTPRLARERLMRLEETIDLLVTHGVSMRETLDTNLDLWQNMYDMRVRDKAFPWVGSSNYFVPITPTQLDTVASRLMQLVVPARLFVVKGSNAEAEQQSHLVEKWYNSKLIKNDWQNAVYHYVHLALKDGTCVMEVTWLKKQHSMNLVVDEPILDPDTGMPVIDPQTGEPVTKAVVTRKDILEYNDVNWEPVELRDFYLFPAWARSIEEAPTVGRVLYLSQSELIALVNAKTLNAKAVEYVIKTINGQSELPEDEHTESYTAGGQIDVSTPSWTDLMGSKQQATYFKVWRLSSREFDLDGDGVFEENILFYHEKTKRLLGYEHYRYAHGLRMYVGFSPMERPKRFYGYAVPERLYGTQIEGNAIHNQRRDEIDLRLSPPMLRTTGAEPDNKQKQWGPGSVWNVGSIQDLQLMQLPDVPVSSWQEEQMLNAYAEKMLGLADQALGANVGGRRTKYEMQLMSASISVRMALMASRLQRALQAIFWQTHQLELQYAPENVPPEDQQLTDETAVPKAILRLDYELGINGMGAPLDRQARRQELLFLYNMMMQNPLVQSDVARVFALTRRVLEEFEIEDTISIIGDEQSAQKMQQARAQAAQQQQQQPQRPGGGQPPHGGGRPAQPNRRSRRQQQPSPVPGAPA